jgi:methyl halide transferase
MSEKNKFEERYQSGETPWELNRADKHLINIISKNIISKKKIQPCKALDIGCGTGSNAIWLAKQGFDVRAVDFSGLAIKKAKEKAENQGVQIQFEVSDFLVENKERQAFDFIFDRGCFHSFDTKEDRKIFAANVSRSLNKDGLWFSILGNADDPPGEDGPPLRSALDIVSATEAFFKILFLVSDHFDAELEKPARCWLCLLRNRS